MSSAVDVVSKTGQYYVVNTSPSVAETEYTIVEGTQAQAEGIQNAGGISGPYTTITKAYDVWKSEPDNKNVSALSTIEAAVAAGVVNIGNPDNPSADVDAGADVQNALSGWQLDVSGVKDWFFRGLMVVGGLFLMGYGVSKLIGVDNAITSVASKVPVL